MEALAALHAGDALCLSIAFSLDPPKLSSGAD
jgi:hypothetical protein